MDTMYRPMLISDYEEVITLWKITPGIGLSTADEKKRIETFLKQNNDTCFVAIHDGKIIGTILCGHDGRRGYMYHLVVSKNVRKKGIGKTLVEKGLSALQLHGIDKCHLFVYATNRDAIEFYRKLGWQERVELKIFSSSMIK